MKSTTEEEIDIQELVVRAIRYLKKNFYFIAVSTVIGILLSYFAFVGLPKIYESKMIVASDMLTEAYGKEMTEGLKSLIRENNVKILASRLNLSPIEAGNIKSIDIEALEPTRPNKKDTIFIVTADILDKEIIPKLQNGIVQFLRNNEFAKVLVRQRKEMYQALIDKMSLEINSLDSLKKRLVQGSTIYSKNSNMILVDPSNISEKIIELTKEQIECKNNLELAESIQLIEGFTVFEKPAEPKLSILMIIGTLGGFFISILILALIRVFKMANSQ
jgi:hypothetical protein